LLAAQVGPRNTLVDGSGLDRANRVTPKAMVRVLTAANANPVWGSALINGLARGGEGTLERRFLAPSLRNRVHAKTGYIAGTSTIAGVVDSRAGVRYAFAIYMNDNAILDAKRTQDRLVSLLATGIADNS
jgi:D-alanyl-D-alanine carboxypeptidase/D-alanyl-D-alanine-endopeptidase (penicillin-binding protein 4)